jgi:AIPR protein
MPIKDGTVEKQRFRELFRDYVKNELQTPFDNLNDKQRSIWMSRFYADTVIRSLNPGLIPETEEDLDACIIDGADDCGVDFLAREGNTVLVIQAKYSSDKKAGKKAVEAAEPFDHFCRVLTRLCAGPSKYKMNQKLKEAVVDIEWDKDNFMLHYITLRQPAQNSFSRAEEGIDDLPGLPDLHDRTTLEIFDEEKLNITLRDALKQELASSQTIAVRFSPSEDQEAFLTFDDPASGRKSYIGRISGAQLADLFRQHKSALFALNIRNYIGDTGTNRAIRKTATSVPNEFFYANNGICAVATRIRPDQTDPSERTLSCERFSIINGAQTVRSLSKAQSDKPDAVRDVQVLLRLVEYDSKITQAEQTFLDNIIRNNNTQNAIKISDFRSNDQVQISLKNHFAKVPALRGKSFVYRNKRSGERDSLHHVIPLEEFIKTLHAFRFGPDDRYGGTSYLFSTDKDGGYLKLFGDGNELKTSLTTDEFHDVAGVWFLCERVRTIWKVRPPELQTPGMERRWLVFWTVGESLRVVYGDAGVAKLEADIRRLSNPSWLDENDHKGSHYRDTIEKHFKLAAKVIKKVYAQAELAESFSHRNWFRYESTLRNIRAELQSFSEFTSELVDQYTLSKS